MQIELQAATVAAILAGMGGGVLWLRKLILRDQNGNGATSRAEVLRKLDDLSVASVRNEERINRLLTTTERLAEHVSKNTQNVSELTAAVKRLCDHVAKG